MFIVFSDIILSIPIASLIHFFSPKSKLIFCKYVLGFPSNPSSSILATIFAVCAVRLIVRLSLHFVTFGFFSKAIIVASVNSFGPFSSFLYVIDQLCHYSENVFSQDFECILSCVFLLFIQSQFTTSAQNVFHLNQCTHGHV